MGQYHYILNFDKKEFISPSQLGSGLKFLEQLYSSPSSVHAVFMLITCSYGRGGGDIFPPTEELNEIDQSELTGKYNREVVGTNSSGPRDPVIGRWAGDRVAVVGDYSKPDDIPGGIDPSSAFYDAVSAPSEWTDITNMVKPYLDYAFPGSKTDEEFSF